MEILFKYYDEMKVIQNLDGGFNICKGEKFYNRSFSQLSDAVIYCMAISNKIGDAGAKTLADLFTTYLNNKNS